MKLTFPIFILSLIVMSCATSPLGRSQLNMMPESQMATMGASSFEEMKKQTPIERDPKVNAYIRCIAEPILIANSGSYSESQNWEIVVFKDKAVNAFALPGRKIGVYTGIIPVANSPSQMAAILGHEVGHVIAHHGNERVSQALLVQGGLAAASVAMKDKNSPKFQLIMAGLGLGAQFGILMPFSRTQESEADVIGLQLMAEAGFDPREAVTLWQNMAKAGGGGPPEFLSTHPSNQTRINNIRSKLPEVFPLFEKIPQAKRPQCSL